MPSSYTSSLRLTLPLTGELSGTWGDVVNNGLTTLADAAIAGTVSVTVAAGDYTLSTANGATDEARRMFVTLAGTPGGTRNIIVPSLSKLYFIKNSTGFAQTVKTSAGTGISVPDGTIVALYCDGTNVLEAITGNTTATNIQTLTNKNLTSGTNTFPTLNQDTTGTSAKTNALNSATTVVNVSSATAPSAGQILTATSSTAATWQTPAASGVSTGKAIAMSMIFGG